ncbi:hypothetical protein C2G38_2267744 [Gigaspora rosea]|uniref:Uncharacterized protein n=1 Tax=Gigaspora rosea TaxID=44941 RepID=A0A397VV05_9GLOM|nr:hypothetical protein C2G38_2267744 [Gigaspora rosea]
MDTEYGDYVTPSEFEDRSRKNYERSSTNYSYYINTRTGDKASVFSRTKSVYVRLEGCNSEEEQEQREREINSMISLYDESYKSHKKDGSVVHVYLVLKQENDTYCEKGRDVDFYGNQNMIDGDALAFYQQPYAFVPDPDWLAALKKTKKYKVKGLLGTDLSTLNNNRQGKHKLNTGKDNDTITRASKRNKK